MRRKKILMGLMVLAGCLLFSGAGFAAEPLIVPIVCELSGSGAASGTRWEKGVLMAVEEINAAGGLLGRKVETFSLDTKTEAPVSIAAMRKAIERKPFVVMGPVYSGSSIACMGLLRDAGIPQFVGSESPSITKQGNPNIFLTSYNAGLSMQKVIKWLTEILKVKKMAILYANSEMGKGGRDALIKLLEPKGVQIVADIGTEMGQADFTGELARIKNSGADTLFIYHHQEESSRILIQQNEMGINKMMRIVGHVTLITESVLKLAKDSANGVMGQVEFSDAATQLKSVTEKYFKKYGELPNHDFYKAYVGMHVVGAVVKETGSFDQQKFRDYLHKHALCAKNHPGIMMDVYYDENGDVDRESFLIKVEKQKQVITGLLDPLRADALGVCKKK
jgi:branched-chain amino acid transport system substrate-binding protein